MKLYKIICSFGLAVLLSAQTKVNLASQTNNANFSGFNPTLPITLYAGTPGTCSIGQMVFNTSVVAGQNLYGCTATNVWTLEGGTGSGGGVSSVGLSLPSSVFSISGSPVTASGVITGAFNSQSANTFLASPTGISGVPVFRSIVAADIPTLNQSTTGTSSNVTGIVAVAHGGSGTATPGLVSGTNVTITGSWPNQTINASGGGGSFPGTTNGDTYYFNGSTTVRLAGPTTVGNFVLSESPVTGGTPVAPVWSAQYTVGNGLGVSFTGSGNVVGNVSMSVRAVTLTTDTIMATDCGGLITYTNASAVSVALPQAGLAGNFLTGCPLTIRNYGTGTVTITPSTSTIGGNSSQAVSTGKACLAVSDGTNYQLGTCN